MFDTPIAPVVIAFLAIFGSLIVIAILRRKHPDREMLLKYADDKLSKEDFEKIHSHVRRCSFCQEEVIDLQMERSQRARRDLS